MTCQFLGLNKMQLRLLFNNSGQHAWYILARRKHNTTKPSRMQVEAVKKQFSLHLRQNALQNKTMR